jgi:hypothetical protein
MPGKQGTFFTGVCIIYPNPYTTRHREMSAIGRIGNITCYVTFTEARFGTFG